MKRGGVLLLDDDADLREALADLVAFVSGRELLGLASVAQLIAERERALSCELAVLDINLGGGKPNGLDAYEWLRAQGFAGKIVFLTGHAARDPIVRDAAALQGARVLSKPIGIDELRAILPSAETRRSDDKAPSIVAT